jgi:PKD repeat protein
VIPDANLLVDGVQEVVSPGAPGSVWAEDLDWVPIVAGDDDTSFPSTFVMARTYGDGRVVIMGHEGLIGNPNLLDNQRLMLNVVSWLDENDGKNLMYSSGHGEWVTSVTLAPLKTELESRGYTLEEADEPIESTFLSERDVLIFGNAWGDVSQSEISAVESFVANGGGLLLIGLGWSWKAYHPGAMEDYPMMRLAAPYGVRWLECGIYDPTNQHVDGSPIFHVFYPDIESPNLDEALEIIRRTTDFHQLDLPQILENDPTLRSGYVQALMTISIPTMEFPLSHPQRQEVYDFCKEVASSYPDYYTKPPTFDPSVYPSMANIRERFFRTWIESVQLNPTTKSEIATLGCFYGRYLDIWNQFGVYLMDNTRLDSAQQQFIFDLLSLIPPQLHDLRIISVSDFLGTRPAQLRLDGQTSSVNIFGCQIGTYLENQFPDDVEPGFTSIFCSCAAHEVNHVVDSFTINNDSGLSQRKDDLIAAAGDDPMNYLRGNGFFVSNPQEFFASIANQWFTDSAKTLDLGLVRFDAGYRHPINQALFFAEVYSMGANVTYFYNTDTEGHISRTEVQLRRDSNNRIVALEYEGTTHVFELDASGDVTGYQLNPVYVGFSGSPSEGIAPLTVNFTDLSTGDINTWQWDFDNNGVVDSNFPNPQCTYDTPGTYTVSLTVSGPGGSYTETKVNYITVYPLLTEEDRQQLTGALVTISQGGDHAWDQAAVDAANEVLSKQEYPPEAWEAFFSQYFADYPAFSDGLRSYLGYPVFGWFSEQSQNNLQQGLTRPLMELVSTFMDFHSEDFAEVIAGNRAERETLMNAHRFINWLVAGSWYVPPESRLPDVLREEVFQFYLSHIDDYSHFLKHSVVLDPDTQPYLGAIRAQIYVNLRDALPLTPTRKDQISSVLGLSGQYESIWNSTSVLIIDNHGLDAEQLSVIENFLQSIPDGLLHLGAITENESLGNTGDRQLWLAAKYVVNIFKTLVASCQSNSFPPDVAPDYIDCFSEVLAHEVNHVVDAYLSHYNPAFGQRKEQLLAAADDDHMNYLRSMFEDGFFTSYPQEFFASIANEWFNDSAKTLELGLVRFDAGYRHPINQALFFAEVYSMGSNVTYFYNTDTEGHISRMEVQLGRDSQNRIVALEYEGTTYVFELDASGDVTGYRMTPVYANFSVSPTEGVAPLTLDFTDLSTGDIDTWQWDFDNNGVVDSDLQDPQHTYSNPGSYTVSLTVSGPGGSDTETKVNYIRVYAPADANFSASPTEGIASLTVNFTDFSTGDINTWQWDFDNNGVVDSNFPNPQCTYDTPGTYSVSLTVSGPGGSDTETKVNYITVYAAANADFSGSPSEGIAPLTVNFTDLSTGDIGIWQWDFDSDAEVDSHSRNPEYVYSNPGSYTVSLTVSGPGGSNTETKVHYITVYAAANADFSASPTIGAAPLTVTFTDLSTGDIDTWEWDFDNDGVIDSNLRNPQHTYNNPGNYTVGLTVSGSGGSDTETKLDYITVCAAPTFSMSNLDIVPTEVTPGETVTISALVINIGSVEGSCTVVLTINGFEQERRTIALDAGDSRTVCFLCVEDTAGDYQVAVDGRIGSFTVGEESTQGFRWWMVGAAVGGLLLFVAAGAAAYRFRVGRRPIES